MYSYKDFEFRKDQQKMNGVRTAIAVNRQISPQGVVYDALINDTGNLKQLKPKSKNNYINQAMEEAMMSSQMILGNSKNEENYMKKQMLIRQSAWCVMLNIDFGQKEFSNYEAMYYDVLSNNGPTED